LAIATLIGLASFFVAIAIVHRIWIGDEPRFFKIALTAVVLIPVIGPLSYVWIGNWPPPNPPHLRSNTRRDQLDAELERLYAGKRSRRAAGRANDEAAYATKRDIKPGASLISKFRQPSRPLFVIILILGAITLAQFWLLALVFLEYEWPWGYPNYWGGSVGSVLLVAMLLVATPGYFWFAVRKWPVNDQN